MSGHRVEVVAKTLFPFMEFKRHSRTPGAPVTPLDCLDIRMLNTVADILNFTYVVRPPKDEQWGTQVNGLWTGMVGTLEAEEADVSMMLFWSFARKQVIDFTRIYTNEPFVMITRKPRPLPRQLALVRPFNDTVWLALLFITIVAGVFLWALQKVWAWFSGDLSPSLTNSLLQAFGILLEDPVMKMPDTTHGQMLVGWWWLFCILMTASYRSSLIAHLSVPTTPPPIDTLKQLLRVRGASWGIEPGFGLGWDWFKLNLNPEVQNMFKTLQVLDVEDQMPLVLKGRHAFFTWKYYIKTIVASQYTTLQGVTPIHMGREEFVPGSTGWGVRKGLPFLPPMDRIHDSLVEAGLVDHWLIELFETSMKKARLEAVLKREAAGGRGEKEEDSFLLDKEEASGGGQQRALVLSINHLQGAFFLLLLGAGIALVFLLGENLLAYSSFLLPLFSLHPSSSSSSS
ncbi:glutamate receptor ionotropic, kainate 5-like isoform X3 [Eriocheir sinensis]|nr:glutamate receptor ionotropic, kainate 5-like isoform X3 [Eriocheir sinensis]